MTKSYILYRHILRKEVSGYKYDKYYYGITKQKFKSRCRGERNYAGKHPITGEKLFWKYIDD